MDHTDQNIAKSIDYLVAHYNEQPEERDLPGVDRARLLRYMNMNHVREFFPDGQGEHRGGTKNSDRVLSSTI